MKTPLAELRRRAARPDDVEQLIHPDGMFVDYERGIAAYQRRDIADFLLPHLRSIDGWSSSNRFDGNVNTSATFGLQPRTPARMREACAWTRSTRETPAIDAALRRVLDEHLWPTAKARFPAKAATLEAAAERVDPAWRWSPPFTQAIVNRTNALTYHTDAGNVLGGMSIMIVARAGRTHGGLLVIPELDWAIETPHGTVIVFDGARWLHGVTPIELLTPGSQRYSVVFYAHQNACHCLPPADEAEWAAKQRTARERRRASGGRLVS